VRVNTIRMLDLWMGRPLCALFTIVAHAGRLLRGRRALPPVRRILFIKLIEQGATVLMHSAIREAVAKVGRDNVYFCVFEENRPILDLLGIVPEQNVFTIRNHRFCAFAMDALRALSAIRRVGIDATIDMEFYSRASALLAYLCGAQRRVGLHRFTSEAPYRGNLMTHRVQYNPYLHAAKLCHLLVHALNHDPDDLPLPKTPAGPLDETVPPFVPTEQERHAAQSMLHELLGTPPQGPIILLNPNAGDLMPLRKWPEERFIALGRRILAEMQNASVILVGDPSERQAAERLRRDIGSPRAVNAAGRTSLRELLALYALSDVMITNDSGPAHFASLTEIETVVLFGPETPELYGPLGGRCHVLWAGLACSPCMNVLNHRFSPCRNNVCMQSITVEEAFEEVRRCLATRKNR